MRTKTGLILIAGIIFVAAQDIGAKAGDAEIEYPKHTAEISSLAPKDGKRVQVNVHNAVSENQCRALIEKYRRDGAPDGQISVHMPSKLLGGQSAPYCVENFDGSGIQINEVFFREE